MNETAECVRPWTITVLKSTLFSTEIFTRIPDLDAVWLYSFMFSLFLTPLGRKEGMNE